jgi:hypothetical protein
VFDGRYRFSRYFAPLDFNTPTTFEALTSKNDLELYDLQEDPEEIDNLARDPAKRDLVMAMNGKLNARIAEEVGEDDGAFPQTSPCPHDRGNADDVASGVQRFHLKERSGTSKPDIRE